MGFVHTPSTHLWATSVFDSGRDESANASTKLALSWKTAAGTEQREDKKPCPVEMTEPPESIVYHRTEKDDPLDVERALREFEGDKDFLMIVIDGFLEKIKGQAKIIRQAITKGDKDVIRKEAHAMKGGASNLTADHFAAIAYELEKIGKSGSLSKGPEVLDRLENECNRLEAFVKRYEDSNH